MVKCGINGFGRLGRKILRVCIEREIDIVAINDANMTASYMAYLLMYDSIHGRFKGHINVQDDVLEVNGQKIYAFKESDPKEIPWYCTGAEYIFEATGLFTTTEKAAQHFNGGAKKVIIAASSPDAPIIMYGINTDDYNSSMKVIATGTGGAVCAAAILKVLHDNFCIVEAFVTCIHAITSDQKTVDGPSEKSWRDGRRAQQNIIPAHSGIAKIIEKVLPRISGKVGGLAFRVPTSNASAVDITVRVGKSACYRDMVNAIKTAACCGPMKGLLTFTEEQVVSSDIINCPASAILDVQVGFSLNDKFAKLIAWFDENYSAANRLVDLVRYMALNDACNKQSGAE